MFVGDSPSLRTGLGRIGRDLSFLASRLPQFRVGYFGRGGHYTRQLPFPQYNFLPNPESQWGEVFFRDAWNDFSRGQKGIVFTVWDPSRLTWFGWPHYETRNIEYHKLGELLNSDQITKWGYFAIDGSGLRPGGGLSGILGKTLEGYNSCLAYTNYGARIIEQSLTTQEIAFLPHGIDLTKFTPRDRKAARLAHGVDDYQLVIGCVMANQPRKDWGALALIVATIKAARPHLKFRVLCRTDDLFMHWSIPALIEDLDIADVMEISTTEISDDDLSYFYSACDLTILPSVGEGFGYPLAESLACGVPAIHIAYAGGQEILRHFDSSYLLEPTAYRVDTRWNVVRPVIDPFPLASLVLDKAEEQMQRNQFEREEMSQKCRAAVEHLGWPRLWRQWERWLLAGIGQGA